MLKKLLFLFLFISTTLTFFPTTVDAGLFQSYPISGKVTNYDMEPIEGAKVKFEIEGLLFGGITTKTDDLGNYYAGLSKAGYCWVTISKDGFKTYRTKYYIGGENTLNVKLDPAKFPTSGKITNRNKEPIVGAKISFELDGGKHGVQSAVTDEYGNYSVGIPEMGNCWVTITADGYTTFRARYYVGRENSWNYTLQ